MTRSPERSRIGRRTPARLGVVLLATVLVASACNPFGGDEEEPPPPSVPPPTPPSRVGASVDGVLRIGAVLPLSGELEGFGPGLKAAVELAVDDVNDSGGVSGEVELFVEDSASTPEGADAAVRTLVAEHAVDAIVGPVSSVELAGGALEAAIDAERVVCSPTASAPRLRTTDDGGFLFSAVANRVGEARLLAEEIAALDDEGDRRVAVVRQSGDADAVALRDALVQAFPVPDGEAAGLDIVADVELDADAGEDAAADAPPGGSRVGERAEPPGPVGAGATSVAAAEEIERARADAVVILALPATGVPFLRALGEAGALPLKEGDERALYVTDTLASDRLAEAVDPRRPALLSGVLGVRPVAEVEGPDDFVERLKAEKAVRSVDFAAQAYDCATLIQLASLAAGTDDPSVFRTEIAKTSTGGSECPDAAACAPLIADSVNVSYTGVSGLRLAEDGEPSSGEFEVFEFDDAGALVAVESRTVEIPEPPKATASTAPA